MAAAAGGLPLALGPHAAHLDPPGAAAAAAAAASSSPPLELSKTLYAWGQPISPHLAVEREGRAVSDAAVAAAVAAELRSFAAAGGGQQHRLAIVETAGGVASPGPSGALQCDLLRPLRLPGVLVGDGRLGGISATLAAYDALALRGHEVPLVVLMDDGSLANSAAIQRHLRGRAHVLAFPVCQPPPAAAAPQQQQLGPPGVDANLAAWLAASAPQFDELARLAAAAHAQRLGALQAAAGDAKRMLWWPFTQHASVGDVTVIDGRVGESFAVYKPGQQGAGSSSSTSSSSSSSPTGASLELQYDACASWWTQGVSAEAQPELVAAVSAAAARYGHVMFPENTHAPALEV